MTTQLPSIPSTRRVGRWIFLGGGAAVIVLLMLLLPLWPSLSYRLTVNELHDELTTTAPGSATIVVEYVDRCWEGVAPASIRILRPVDGADVNDLRADYTQRLRQLGFSVAAVGSESAWSREREDGFDGDIVRFSVDYRANTLTVIADTYDTDSVVCLPF